MKPQSNESSPLDGKSNLRSQLNVINRAIQLVSDLKSDSTKPNETKRSNDSLTLTHSSFLDNNHDKSYIIEMSSAQTVICPDCFSQVHYRDFILHQTHFCENKVVVCPGLGCGKLLHQKNLQFHVREECITAVARKKLLTAAAEKSAKKGELEAQILESYNHQRNSILQQHTTLPTPLESKHTEPQFVICPQCGEGIRESQCPEHMSIYCSFRPISCPNYPLGCPKQSVPLCFIQLHLQQDCIVEKRKEEMILNSKKRSEFIPCSICGYQVELRLWKKHERELCENRLVPCKNQPLGCSVMVPLIERDFHERVDENYERYCLYLPGHGSFMQIEESDVSCPWTAEYWIYRPLPQDSLRTHLRNMFMSVWSYEVAYISEFVIRNKVMKLVNALKDDATLSKPVSRDGKKLSKLERQRIQQELMQIKVNLINELSSLIPVYSDAVLAYIRAFQSVAICVEASLDCLKELTLANHDTWDPESELSLQTEYPGEVATVTANKTEFGDTNATKSGNTTARTVSSEEELEYISSARVSDRDYEEPFFNPDNLSQNVENSVPAKSILQDGQSALAKYFQYCYYSLLFPANKSNSSAEMGELYYLSFEKNALEDQFIKIFGYTQLPEEVLCQFLVQFLIDQSSAIKRFSFKAKLWKKILDAFAALLKTDFDELQDWRIEAGLITPTSNQVSDSNWSKSEDGRVLASTSVLNAAVEPIHANADSDDVQDDREKKRKRKEQERQRRELKKLQSKRLLGEEVNEWGGVGEVESEIIDSNERVLENAGAANSAEKRLLFRVTELLKSSCGCEIINESNSADKLLQRSHICLSMYSGLSLLIDNEDDSASNIFSSSYVGKKNHYYELLINSREMKKLLEMKGQLGFIAAASNHLEDNYCDAEQAVLLGELLGTQPICSEYNISRGRWSHIAFSSMRKPHNRVLLYLDGALIGNFKNCSFPLPMLSLGGSPFNLLSFSGLLLDVRYWNYCRSGRQINLTMHGLIRLSLNAITNVAATTIMKTAPNQPSSSQYEEDFGLIAWWTMDDGPCFDVVTDVTRHRFKTRIVNRRNMNYYWNFSEPNRYEVPLVITHELPSSILLLKDLLANQQLKGREKSDDARYDIPESSNNSETKNIQFNLTSNPFQAGNHVQSDELRLELGGMLRRDEVSSDVLQFGGNGTESARNNSANEGKKHNFLKSLAKFKWIKAESVKTLTSLLSYEIPKFQAVSEEAIYEENGGKRFKINSSLKISMQKGMTKKMSTDASSSKKLPLYLLEERLLRNQEVSAQINGDSNFQEQSILPIPSFREQNICPFELRRHRLARCGRELQKFIVCPLNCDQPVRKTFMRFHIRYQCARRYVTCFYEGCNMIFCFNDREHHEKFDCVISKRRVMILQEAEDKNLPIICSSCSVEIPLRRYEMHKASECIYRLIFCSNDDCSFGRAPGGIMNVNEVVDTIPMLPANLLEHHLKYNCNSAKVKNRCMLIDRSRNRKPYPRPWGISIEEER